MPITIFRSGDLYFVRFSVNRHPKRAAFVVGNFTAYMKPIELEFCGSDYCAYVSLPPGKYYYRYLIDGEVILDNGPMENGFNVLILRGAVRKLRMNGRRLFRAIYGIFVDRFGCRREGGPRDRLGGDLSFIRDKLGYIRSMGFDAIYLTPIFRAMSYHRYDVTDYLNVDDDLGGNEAFKELLRRAHDTVYVLFENEFGKPVTVNMTLTVDNEEFNYYDVTIMPGYYTVALNFTVDVPQGIYTPTLTVYSLGTVLTQASLPSLYVLNTTGKPPISLVIVWNMHQPLYIEPNGTWEQAWVLIHTCHDFLWNGTWVGAYELQAMLLSEYNVSVTIDFTPVLLYQWETILTEGKFPYSPVWPSPSTLNVNMTQCLEAINYTLSLYRELAQEGRVEILTVPFYHPLQAIIYDNGWQSDLLAQILMGEEMTEEVFGVKATGAWTPEMAFNMGLIHLYNETGIEFTILDAQAFLPYATVVSGTPSPYGPIIVEDSTGEQLIVLFRDTDLSNAFSFAYFSQSPQVTARELIHYLARIYMQNPGAVMVALDGENTLIFNPTTGPADLQAIYQVLSEYQGTWFITQTASEAIATHKPIAVLTNLPESSWALNLNNWNNGYPGKVEIWRSVALAREYLVAFTKAVGMPISPIVPLPLNITPNSTNPIYTLWNYLYVAEGSDWTWQTGPPNYGPAWFPEQALTYTSAIINTIKGWLSEIKLVKYVVEDDAVVLQIYNGLNYTLYVTLVVSNGTYTIAKPIILRSHHITTIPVIGIENATIAQLYSPVTDSELGDHPILINQYGFPLVTFTLSHGNSQAITAMQGESNDLVTGLIAVLLSASVIMMIILIQRDLLR